MAFLSHSLKASGLDIKFACAVQRVEKSGTPSSITFLSFSPRSHRVRMTQSFIARGVMTGKKSRESALMLHLDLLEITPAQIRQSFSLICGSRCPPQEPQSEMSRQLPSHWRPAARRNNQGCSAATSTGAPAIRPQPGKPAGAKESVPQHPVEATPHQLFGEEQFYLPRVEVVEHKEMGLLPPAAAMQLAIMSSKCKLWSFLPPTGNF